MKLILKTEQKYFYIFKNGVKIGYSNPNIDSCGYRTMIVKKLAEKFYEQRNFFNKLFGYGESYSGGKENSNKVIVKPKV